MYQCLCKLSYQFTKEEKDNRRLCKIVHVKCIPAIIFPCFKLCGDITNVYWAA